MIENGHRSASKTPLRVAVPVAYLVLQGAGSLLLVSMWFGWKGVQPWLAPQAGSFGSSWIAAFILLPISFAPVLFWWFGWVQRRFGPRPRAWRFTAEVAFAVQVIGCLLLQGIA